MTEADLMGWHARQLMRWALEAFLGFRVVTPDNDNSPSGANPSPRSTFCRRGIAHAPAAVSSHSAPPEGTAA